MGGVALQPDSSHHPVAQGSSIVKRGDERLLRCFDDAPRPVVPTIESGDDFIDARRPGPGFPLPVIGLSERQPVEPGTARAQSLPAIRPPMRRIRGTPRCIATWPVCRRS